MKKCYLCKEMQCSELLNLGHQPVCHDFPTEAEKGERYPLILSQCEACGLVQLIDPFPVGKLTPRYDWMKYREPEAHLVRLADSVSSLPGIGTQSRMLGLSLHDDALLKIMQAKGFKDTQMVNPAEDLGFNRIAAGVEFVQDRLTPSVAKEILLKRGSFDILVARRIVEHAYDLSEFLHALRLLVRSNGYIIIEVPDSQHAFEQADVGMIWEEHILYFTPATFLQSFSFNGLKNFHFENYPYLQENCLVAIVQPDDISAEFPKNSILRIERSRALTFASKLMILRKNLHQFLSGYRDKNEKVAVLGAGHRSSMYINVMELKDFLEFVIDDDPNKQSLRMPGSYLPIRGSSSLVEHGIRLCLLAINPESEEKVIQKNRAFLENGGSFLSISPDSKYALRF